MNEGAREQARWRYEHGVALDEKNAALEAAKAAKAAERAAREAAESRLEVER